jgi:vancomycin resistance protein YoaR
MTGQLSLENILNKNLIQISTAKSRKYEIVQNKLREQIKENLNNKTNLDIPDKIENDLVKTLKTDVSNNMFTSGKFNDTFKHFSDQLDNINNSEIGAYDGSDFSYL